MSLFALLLTLLLPQAESPLPLLETGMLNNGVYTSFITIAPDGRWIGPSDLKGELAPDDLARVKVAVGEIKLNTTPGPECPSIPVLQTLRVPRGEVRYSRGCGPQPDPRVITLVQMVESLTARRPNPTVVRLYRWRAGQQDRKEAIILQRSGLYTTDNGAGNTGGPELAAIIEAFEAAKIEAVPPSATPDCAGDYHHDLELPGRGRLIWRAPCQAPSPTLSAALARLYALVGVQP